MRRRTTIAALGGACLSLALGAGLGGGCESIGRRLVASHFEAQRQRAGLELARVSASGHSIAYAVGGPSDGEVVVLVHGFTGDKSNWYPFAAALTDRYRVVALDLPPFGASPAIAGVTYDLPGHVARLAAFVDALRLERFHLVGSSMGGHTSALYAHGHPGRVRSLALLDSAGVTPPVQSELARLTAQGDNPFAVDDAEDFDRLMGLVFHDPPWVPPPARSLVVEQLRRQAPRTRALLDGYLASWVPLEPLLPEIVAPTLVVWGAEDRITDPTSVPIFAAGLPKAKSVVLEGCGHVPMMELPEESARRYLEFLATTRG